MRNLKFLILVCGFTFYILHFTFYSFAQDNNKLVVLSKQIMEAGSSDESLVYFTELKDLYLRENKYNEFTEFLNSLAGKKKTLSPVINYYIALTRYTQLKHLEETQSWDEYFSQGNAYRDELTTAIQSAIDNSMKLEALHIQSKLLLWRFHKDQQDAFGEEALTDLFNSVLEYAKGTSNMNPIKETADTLLFYGEKGRSKEIYRVYADKIISSDIKVGELKDKALDFYREGNLELSEALYDVYIDKISSTMAKEKLAPVLADIARQFASKGQGLNDEFYAETIFKRIEEFAGKNVFTQELIYLRGLNLEKAKEYNPAKDIYLELIKNYPSTSYGAEADFKLGIIYTYVLRDIKSGKNYFKKLTEKEILTPQAISGLYQLGLLSYWEGDLAKAKEYYVDLIEKAGDNFLETTTLAKERLKEIEEARPMEYALKIFLDASFKEEYANLALGKSDLRTHPYITKKGEEVKVSSNVQALESGCFEVMLQYLWSGHTGQRKPPADSPSFNTAYTDEGTKEINLVVVSPSGIVDRNIYLTDIH